MNQETKDRVAELELQRRHQERVDRARGIYGPNAVEALEKAR